MIGSREVDVSFLAFVIWREARGEIPMAQAAVGYSIMNRVERPCWWGRDLLSVIFKKWQYSSMSDPKDRQLETVPKRDASQTTGFEASFARCLLIAEGVILKTIENPVPGADSYYDDSISAPAWTSKARFVRKLGRLNFYDVDHDFQQKP